MCDVETKYFIKNFVRFLGKQIEEKAFSADVIESLEVASQCLETAYELQSFQADAAISGYDEASPQNHIDLFELFQNACIDVQPERKKEAEIIKNEGNRLMKENKYQEGLLCYNKAICLDATNPVFYCNRAAAWNRLNEYQKAIDDCKMSLRYDPNYSRAYARLGIAYTKLNKMDLALDAYENAVRLEPENSDYQTNLQITKQRIEETRANPAAAAGLTDPIGNLANVDMDFAAAFNNPELMTFVSRMINDPSIQTALTQIANRNSIEAVLGAGRQLVMDYNTQNPELFANMRRQMGGGADGGATGGPNPAGPDGTTDATQPAPK